MRSAASTNWVCIMINSVGTSFCEEFCDIQRVRRNAVEYTELLTDEQNCMDAFNTGDTFSYATNDALSCPLVQILAPVDGLAEDF